MGGDPWAVDQNETWGWRGERRTETRGGERQRGAKLELGSNSGRSADTDTTQHTGGRGSPIGVSMSFRDVETGGDGEGKYSASRR
jgi:hypothetical protein